MKLFTCLLLGGSFNWKQPLGSFTGSASLSLTAEKYVKILDLLNLAQSVGQVGSLASEEDQRKMEQTAQELIPFSDSKEPAKYPLTGMHNLVYSAAPGASSGKIGPLVGKVSQFFEDGDVFYNRVAFGPLEIALRAKREVMNGSTIKVSFLETSFNLFGKTIKKSQAGGGGVWKVNFVGTYQDKNGKEKLVRIMNTPSLFVLESDVN
jgi:hypothetical protein